MRAPDARGFTLVELLLGLTLGALVLTLAFQAVLAHGRYARVQAERAHAQQHGRGAWELIASELRLADPASFVEATPSSLRFARQRAWGLVCGHTADRLFVLFAPHAVAAFEPADEWLAIPPVGSSVEWLFVPVADLTSNSAERSVAAARCAELGHGFAPAPGALTETRAYGERTAHGSGGTLGLNPGEVGLAPGTAVYLFSRVRYELAPSSTGPGLWIRRNSGPALQMQPLAGPIRSGGLRFTYLGGGGEVLVPPLDAQARRGLQVVEVFIAPQSGRGDGDTGADASVRILLRNAR